MLSKADTDEQEHLRRVVAIGALPAALAEIAAYQARQAEKREAIINPPPTKYELALAAADQLPTRQQRRHARRQAQKNR